MTMYMGKLRSAHRIAFVEANNISWDSIKGLVVRHKCDNPSCINPEHLCIGTQADNIRDMMERNRGFWLSREKHGMAKLTEEQVREIRKEHVWGSKTHGSSALGRKYSVNEKTIRLIIKNINWRE